MKIAITGATGFIGSYVIKSLIQLGYEIVAVGRSNPVEHPLVKFVEFDLLNDYDYSWLSQHKPTHLLHLAWYAEHGKYWTSCLNLRWCDSSLRLIEAFYDCGGERVVAAGTCAEYDWSFGYCKENLTPSNPTTLYGIAKDSTRRMAMEISHINNASLAWGRIFFPVGLGEDVNRLIPSIIQTFLGNKQPFPIGIYQWRDFLPVEVVADAFIFLLLQQASGTFNICSGKPVQIGDIIKHIANVLATDPNVLLSLGVEKNNSPNFLIGDNSVLSSLGWQTDFNLETSLAFYTTNFSTKSL